MVVLFDTMVSYYNVRFFKIPTNYSLLSQSSTAQSQLDPLPRDLPFEIISKTIGRGAYAS